MKKLITVIMASLLLYSGYVLGTCAAADEVYTTKTVTVYSGDTMWDMPNKKRTDNFISPLFYFCRHLPVSTFK